MGREETHLGRDLRGSFPVGLRPVDSEVAACALNACGGRNLIVHAGDGWHKDARAGTDAFLPKLIDAANAAGIACHLVRAGSRESEQLLHNPRHYMHLLMGGAPRYAPNLLHVEESYIKGFWYLDETGPFADSTLRHTQFCPDNVDWGAAEYFFNGVRGWMLEHNVSKAEQAPRNPDALDPARAVVFLQDIEQDRFRSHYLTNAEMLRTIGEHERSRPVYVKPHPRHDAARRAEIESLIGRFPNLRLSDASVHDLIAKADVVVTQNSAAGFEALMQKKPVVTCAKSDYRHATLTARTASELCDGIDYGADAMADFPFEKFFYWFLHRHMLEEAKDNFAKRAMRRIREKALC